MKECIEIIDEIRKTTMVISQDEVENLISFLNEAKHIYLAGMGRSGLVAKGFANRLLHLGFSVSVVGEITSPHSKEGDLLIIISGSGNSNNLLQLASEAADKKVTTYLITTSNTVKMSPIVTGQMLIPAQSKVSNTQTRQPMGSLFEQTTGILLDAIVLKLMSLNGETNETMKSRHADFE